MTLPACRIRRIAAGALLAALVACSHEAPAPPARTSPPAPPPPGAVPPPTSIPSTSGEPSRAVALALGAELPAKVAQLPLATASGQALALGQVRRDKGLLVVFTCNSCPYARAWDKRLVALGNEFEGQGIGVAFVNSTDPRQSPDDLPERLAARVSQSGQRFPYLADPLGLAARALGAARTPEAFLFDAQGRLVYHGAVDDNAQDERNVTAFWLRDALSAVALGRSVPVAETKALGCAIRLAPPG